MGTRDVPLSFQFEVILGKDRDRWPPEARFIDAAHHGDVREIKKIAKELDVQGHGIPVTVASTTYMGMNALHAAGGSGNLPAYRYLIEEVKMDVNKPDTSMHCTPVEHAINYGNLPAVRYLLDHGADLHQKRSGNVTLLHSAAVRGQSEIVKFLLSRGADVDALAVTGTPLSLAAFKGHASTIKILLQHKADPHLWQYSFPTIKVPRPHPLPVAPFAPKPAQAAAPLNNAMNGWPIWPQGNNVAADDHHVAAPVLNAAGPNLDFIFPQGGFDLNAAPLANGLDLNNVPHELNEEEFIELNDLINPVIENFHMDAPLADMANQDHAQQGDSSLTLTVSSDPSLGSGGSVNALQHINQNVHIGMVLVPEIQFHKSPLPSASAHVLAQEGTRAWSSFFKPIESSSDCISVPTEWANFIIAKLMNPEDFGWSKSLLQSKIWNILRGLDNNTDSALIEFALPKSCPAGAPPSCFLTEACKDLTQGYSTPQAPKRRFLHRGPPSTSVLHFKRRSSKTPLVVLEVRRSDRIRERAKGFKNKTCFDRNCLACTAVPPRLKKKVVQNLLHRFEISETEDLTAVPAEKDKEQDDLKDVDGRISDESESE